jgi:cyclin-dependent kinase 7
MTMDAVREVKALQELSHPNIIALLAVFSTKDQNLNLVLEYLPLGDLEVMIRDVKNISYTMQDIKAWMGMLCRAVWFCHENFILHRDIKPNNLLIAADGQVKLADFGLARTFADPYAPMTYNVITRWYRPPELFYRARYYSGAVDVWSVGCVFAELVLRVPFMPGNTDVDQLNIICREIGSPTEDIWPGVTSLEGYLSMDTPIRTKKDFQITFPQLSPAGIDLLMKMLSLNPNNRITARAALQHDWWTQLPKPSRNEDLPRKGGGETQLAEDLKRRGGELDDSRLDKVARKLDFSSMVR